MDVRVGPPRRLSTKNWAFWTVVLEKTLESPLDNKEIQPVHPKGNQSWIFIGRTAAEAETPLLWPPDVKSWLIWKDHDAEKDWRREEKGTTEDEIIGWHHWLDGPELSELRELVVDKEPWLAVVPGLAKSQTRLSGWTEETMNRKKYKIGSQRANTGVAFLTKNHLRLGDQTFTESSNDFC